MRSDGLIIPADELDVWLEELKPYQKSSIKKFLGDGLTPEEAAERWLGTTGSPNIVPFGGQRNLKPFWENFKKEFHRFICDDSAYVVEKEQFGLHSDKSKAIVIATVSSALGASIGLAATLLVPAVVMLLFVVGKMGRQAYCAL